MTVFMRVLKIGTTLSACSNIEIFTDSLAEGGVKERMGVGRVYLERDSISQE